VNRRSRKIASSQKRAVACRHVADFIPVTGRCRPDPVSEWDRNVVGAYLENTMGRYVLSRVALAIPTLLLLTLAAFLLTSAARGDPAVMALRAGGQEPTPEAIAEYRERLGLNNPLPVRYAHWLGNAVQGDFGRSILDQREVSQIIGERLGPTWASFSV
jgi:ABC-type microcin C transport system permease subunit YejB